MSLLLTNLNGQSRVQLVQLEVDHQKICHPDHIWDQDIGRSTIDVPQRPQPPGSLKKGNNSNKKCHAEVALDKDEVIPHYDQDQLEEEVEVQHVLQQGVSSGSLEGGISDQSKADNPDD